MIDANAMQYSAITAPPYFPIPTISAFMPITVPDIAWGARRLYFVEKCLEDLGSFRGVPLPRPPAFYPAASFTDFRGAGEGI